MSRLGRLRGYINQFDRGLWILSLGWLIASLGFASSIPFISIYFHARLGMSTTEIGMFFAVMAIVRAVFQAAGGEISDRVGRRPLLIHLPWLRVVTFVALALAVRYEWGFWPIAVILLFNFIAGSIFITAIMAMVSDIVPHAKRLDGFAISRSAGNAGWAIGPAIGGYLAASSYSELFYFSAAVTLIGGLVFLFYLKVPQVAAPTDRFRFGDLLALRKDPSFAWHAVLTLCLYLVVAQLVMPLSVYVVEMVGLSEASLGHLLTLNGAMVVLLQIPITRLTGRFRLTTLLAMGAVIYFIGYALMGTLIGFWWFMGLIFIVTIGELLISPPTMTLTSRLAPEGRTGRYMGVYGFFVTLGWSLGPLYGGAILDGFKHDWMHAWWVISSLAIVAAIGFHWLGRWLPRHVNEAQASLDNN